LSHRPCGPQKLHFFVGRAGGGGLNKKVRVLVSEQFFLYNLRCCNRVEFVGNVFFSKMISLFVIVGSCQEDHPLMVKRQALN